MKCSCRMQNYDSHECVHLSARSYKDSTSDYFMNCFNAVGLFDLLILQVFFSGILHWVFSGSNVDFSVFPHITPLRVKSAD